MNLIWTVDYPEILEFRCAMEHVSVNSVAAICDALGRRRIADVVGVRVTAVSNAVSDGRFSARWFDAIDKMCGEAGIPCPRHLFSFVGVEADDGLQGGSIPQPAASAAPTNESCHVETSDGC